MWFNAPIYYPSVAGDSTNLQNALWPTAVANRAASGVIPLANANTNVNTVFQITQTTANLDLQLPSPTTNSTGARIYTVKNTGTVAFTLYGQTLFSNETTLCLWNGSTFSAIGNPVDSDRITTTSTALTVSQWESVILVTATTGVINITLPTNTNNLSKEITVVKVAGTFAVTVTGTGIIGGGTTISQIGDSTTFKALTATQTLAIGSSDSSTPNSPNSAIAPIAIANLATGGNIGTALATVDVNSHFVLTQTTAGQTITLPNPTVTTGARLITLESSSSSTATFSLYGSTIKVGNRVNAVWNGSSWGLTSSPTSPNYSTSTNLTAYPTVTTITHSFALASNFSQIAVSVRDSAGDDISVTLSNFTANTFAITSATAETAAIVFVTRVQS